VGCKLKEGVIKGTVSVISSDPPCKDGNARYTTVPLKALSDDKCGRYCHFSRFKSVPSLILLEMRKSLLKRNFKMKVNSI